MVILIIMGEDHISGVHRGIAVSVMGIGVYPKLKQAFETTKNPPLSNRGENLCKIIHLYHYAKQNRTLTTCGGYDRRGRGRKRDRRKCIICKELRSNPLKKVMWGREWHANCYYL